MLVMPRCDRYTARSAWRALLLTDHSTLIVLVPPSLGVELAILPQLGKAFDLDVRVPIHRGPPTLADADESLSPISLLLGLSALAISSRSSIRPRYVGEDLVAETLCQFG
ncbi:hypothetical protein C6P46_001769 [Rhodotorula mucilaginosa]|uniref:Uncharacterized protein n=1 Tax=Rhodotorula mucilaginosa TaxID=5537 RepID=A0A9P6VTE5_RHOMI|nr:hypothetical protein C6P46_001769 [Rhodotorula mucilaginosa]